MIDPLYFNCSAVKLKYLSVNIDMAEANFLTDALYNSSAAIL